MNAQKVLKDIQAIPLQMIHNKSQNTLYTFCYDGQIYKYIITNNINGSFQKCQLNKTILCADICQESGKILIDQNDRFCQVTTIKTPIVAVQCFQKQQNQTQFKDFFAVLTKINNQYELIIYDAAQNEVVYVQANVKCEGKIAVQEDNVQYYNRETKELLTLQLQKENDKYSLKEIKKIQVQQQFNSQIIQLVYDNYISFEDNSLYLIQQNMKYTLNCRINYMAQGIDQSLILCLQSGILGKIQGQQNITLAQDKQEISCCCQTQEGTYYGTGNLQQLFQGASSGFIKFVNSK